MYHCLSVPHPSIAHRPSPSYCMDMVSTSKPPRFTQTVTSFLISDAHTAAPYLIGSRNGKANRTSIIHILFYLGGGCAGRQRMIKTEMRNKEDRSWQNRTWIWYSTKEDSTTLIEIVFSKQANDFEKAS
jgi:hypothetical protein